MRLRRGGLGRWDRSCGGSGGERRPDQFNRARPHPRCRAPPSRPGSPWQRPPVAGAHRATTSLPAITKAPFDICQRRRRQAFLTIAARLADCRTGHLIRAAGRHRGRPGDRRRPGRRQPVATAPSPSAPPTPRGGSPCPSRHLPSRRSSPSAPPRRWAQGADPNLGRNLAATCANCHGTNGVSAGRHAESLAGTAEGRPRAQDAGLQGRQDAGDDHARSSPRATPTSRSTSSPAGSPRRSRRNEEDGDEHATTRFPEGRRRAASAIAARRAAARRWAAAASGKVVVVGGGYGGATVAKYLRMWSNGGVDVTLVEPNAEFVSCPMSNLVLGGSKTIADVTVSYDSLAQAPRREDRPRHRDGGRRRQAQRAARRRQRRCRTTG